MLRATIRSRADADAVPARSGYPPARGALVVAHVLAGDAEGEPLALPSGQGDLLEPLELERRLACRGRVGEIQLGDLGPGRVSGVGDGDLCCGTALGRCDPEVAVGERGVGQAVPEREQRRLAVGVVVPVSDVDAF